VFVGFTLSQTGMVLHWRKEPSGTAKISLAMNAVGAIATGVVALVILSTKFMDGAWLTVTAIAILTFAFLRVHQHYQGVSSQLEVREPPPRGAFAPAADRYRDRPVLVPVDDINQAVLRTVEYARTISDNVTAVHVTDEREEGERFRDRWEALVPDAALVVIESPYRSFIAPMLTYVDALDRVDPGAYITVVIPEFVPAHFWEGLLHNQSAIRLKKALMHRPNTIVIDVPYHLHA
jgi:hypothetical protein